MSGKKYQVTARWRALSKEQKIAEIREAMQQGHSNTTAAEALGATPGIVAGIRYKNNIPPRSAPPSRAAPRTPAPAWPRPKLAASEATQCVHCGPDKLRCAYERVAGSLYCVLHN